MWIGYDTSSSIFLVSKMLVSYVMSEYLDTKIGNKVFKSTWSKDKYGTTLCSHKLKIHVIIAGISLYMLHCIIS